MRERSLALALVIALALGTTSIAATVTIGHRVDTNHSIHLGLVAAAELFANKRADITVEIAHGIPDDKFITLVLGGVPTDLHFIDGPLVSSHALRGLIQPIGKYVEASGIDKRDFVPPAWEQNVWENEIWAMPVIVDPNFALVWNKEVFENAGLSSDLGPATLADYEAYHKRLTRYADSKLEQIGTVPWEVYGEPNTMYTWGWIFGGSFYEPSTKQVTAHHPHNVEALEWLRDYHTCYSSELGTLNAGLPSGRNRFTAGREAMRFFTTGDLFNFLRVAPDVSVGVGKMPYRPESGVTDPAWVGGWCVAMPAGADNPDAAWEFLRFISADPEGTAAYATASGWFPGFLRTPVFRDVFSKDPILNGYMEVLLSATNQRPVMPVQTEYWHQLTIALQDVFAGRNQPLTALETASQRVTDALAQALSVHQ